MSTLNEACIIRVRNVNGALSKLRAMLRDPRRDYYWRDISPRGLQTMEYRGPVITEYSEPTERVLWSPYRDANPFFHLMESLWILAGRKDVAFLTEFNAGMAQYSDNTLTFHAPYGYRLRHWPGEFNHLTHISTVDDTFDQLKSAIELLRKDHSTRQVVLSIWNPEMDLGRATKDMPCNDLLMLKIRDGELNLTVACRSNDAIWGAYGANVVQFSMIQEFIASAVGVEVGTYRQISDSFHVYTDQPAWKSVLDNPNFSTDPYQDMGISPFPLFSGFRSEDYGTWLTECEAFCEGKAVSIPFFRQVAAPVRAAWRMYKSDTSEMGIDKKTRAVAAANYLSNAMPECDWQMACVNWLLRRGGAK